MNEPMTDEMLAVIARGGGWVSLSEVGARGHDATTVARMAGEILRLRALVAAAGEAISEIGCECACDHSTEEDHDDDCDPCSVCRIADALQPSRGAR